MEEIIILNPKQLDDIQGLQKLCEHTDSISLKLNWDMLASRQKTAKHDFFHYTGETLTGFLALYPFGDSFEVCGMVHPEYRRQGIFSGLWIEALEVLMFSDYKTILLNTPAASSSGTAFIKSLDGELGHSEYQMQWFEQNDTRVMPADPTVRLRMFMPSDAEEIIRMDQNAFEMSYEESEKMYHSMLQESAVRKFIIERDGITAGKVRLEDIDSSTWIYGFTVKAGLRGQGIGRSALLLIIAEVAAKGKDLWLEVAVQNPNALKLYESCGFKVMRQQDYYDYKR